MGKKQLGELQPFEFAISLIVADLACIPMSDISVPIWYGLVPIFTLFVLHLLVTKLVKHSIRMRGTINGHPIIIITPDGIDYKMLKKLDMTINDLLESLRSQGHFSPSDINYAIVETNGNVSIMPKDDENSGQASMPITLITEGKMLSNNFVYAELTKEDVDKILEYLNLKLKNILLLTTDSETIYAQPLLGKAITISMSEVGL